MKKILVYILIFIAICLIAFFFGYKTGLKSVDLTTDTLYIKGDTVTQTINHPEPYSVTDSIPYIVEVPGDTTWIIVDTFEILKDYLKVRKYELTKSNDTVGTFMADITVTKNKIDEAVLKIVPVTRVVNTVKPSETKEKVGFYGIVGTGLDLKTIKIQGAAILNDKYVIGASAIHFNNNYGYTIDFGIKF